MEFKVNDWVEVVKTTASNGRKITGALPNRIKS